MPNVSDGFADELMGLAIDLARAEASVQQEVLGYLKELEEDITARLQRLGRSGTAGAQLQRLQALRLRVRDLINKQMGLASATLTGKLLELSDITQGSLIAIGEKVLGGSVMTTAFTRGDLRALTRQTLVQGAPLRDWWSRQSQNLQHRFVTQMRMGILSGETNDQLINRLRGAPTGRTRKLIIRGKVRRVKEYSAGIMNTSYREASTLVRTSVQTASNEVMKGVYDENADLVEGIQALATLDNRTSPVCISRSGASWNRLTGEPLPESPRDEPFPGYPPWHPNCRTVIIPKIRSWEDLIEEATGKRLKLFEDEIPVSTRASMNGEVASDLDYEKWLRTRPVAEQREKLGRARYEMWKDGSITTAQLTDYSGRPLTVDELRNRRGLVQPASN